MENDVIFSDEMDHSCIFLLPPFFPITVFLRRFGAELDRIGDIADRRIEPYIKHFSFRSFYRHRNTPFEVTRHGTRFESAVQPTLALTVHVRTPFLVIIEDPIFEPCLILIQRQVPVLGRFLGQRIACFGIVRVDQFVRREGCAAFLALVAISAHRMTTRTFTTYITVGQEMTCLRIIELFGCLFDELTRIIHLTEIICCKLVMRLRGGTRIDIERYPEIGKRTFDQFMIAIDHLLGRDTFFACTNGNRYTMFVASANEQHFLTLQTQITGINVRGYIHSGEVTDMHRTVRIRERCCD